MNQQYDIIARKHKETITFMWETEKGREWIRRNWGDVAFETNALQNAAAHIKRMNYDGISVALLCGV